jgi:D-sedoheptulose 7-phosphate isomerase
MESIDEGLRDAAALVDWLRRAEREDGAVSKLADRLAGCLRDGHRILACGNGGSMCDAMHFAEELSGRFRGDRGALSALALSDPAHLTCVANDWGFEHVFARGVQAWGSAGDLLVVFSTSGESRNLLVAADCARERGLGVVGLLGRGGGPLAARCDASLIVPGVTADRIQEVHIKVVHLLVNEIERALLGSAAAS